MPRDVVKRLRAVGPSMDGVAALILPTQTRDGRTYYLADDMEALRSSRAAGLDAAYLVKQGDRRYLNEFSAGWVLELSIAVGENLLADVIAGVSAYVWVRARAAVRLGRHPGPDVDVPVKVTIAHVMSDAQGTITIEGLQIEGPAQGAATVLERTLTGIAATREPPVAPELGAIAE